MAAVPSAAGDGVVDVDLTASSDVAPPNAVAAALLVQHRFPQEATQYMFANDATIQTGIAAEFVAQGVTPAAAAVRAAESMARWHAWRNAVRLARKISLADAEGSNEGPYSVVFAAVASLHDHFSRADLYERLQDILPPTFINSALAMFEEEGLVYSTIDNDHFSLTP